MTAMRMSLGDYEQQVILELDNQLSIEEARPLMRGAIARKLPVIIADFHSRRRTTHECSTAILEFRLALLLVVSQCDVLATKQNLHSKQLLDREEPSPKRIPMR